MNMFPEKQKYLIPTTCAIKPNRNWVTCHSKLRYWETVVNFSFWDHKSIYYIFDDIRKQIKLISDWVNIDLSKYGYWGLFDLDSI